MNNKINEKNGSILIFTLLILSIIIILTQQLVKSVMIGYSYSNSQVSIQQAKTLALGGIKLAISQLEIKHDETKKSDKNQSEKLLFKKFLGRILPNINKWQIFDLKDDIDGIDGQIKFCITCENSKININKAFDFEKNEFKENYRNLLKGLEIKNKLKAGEIEKRLVEYFKKRKKPLDDISELINVKGLEQISVFYDPPIKSKNKKINKPNSNIYLQDLFTIWTDSENLQFLFLSDSMLAILGLRRSLADDSIVLKKQYKNFIQSFDKSWLNNLKDHWNNFIPIYGRNNKLSLVEKILDKEFAPKVYSVISCGNIKNVEQKLLVVLKEVDIEEKKEKPKDNSAKESISEKKKQQAKQMKTFKIIRMYWL